MRSLRKWIREAFGFSGTEINGFLILIPLVLLLLASEPLYHHYIAARDDPDNGDEARLDSLIAAWAPAVGKGPGDGEIISLFAFDPNTAEVSDLRKLGFGENSSRYIAAYRRKGGVFRVKSDLLRIYGLDSSLYKRLYDYISLPTQRLPDRRGDRTFTGPQSSRRKKQVQHEFDINTADTLQLKSVYGIGPTFAARIIKFRDGLGGFVSPDQLFEVYGLDSITVKRLLNVCFIEPDFIPRKININTADERELSAHPYIRYKTARLLVSYRFQHGDFTDLSDIKKLSALEPREVDRLLPYLKIKE
ncbi:MAG TPA: helix-hairpin-helix domain-containing protein [Cyclobacteriaceae bacterium]|nr:helix-hairpin-helix domain-containing protein [Cyclobacteriaceae bacterium]